jgi:hypothetical protein
MSTYFSQPVIFSTLLALFLMVLTAHLDPLKLISDPHRCWADEWYFAY